MTGRLPPINCRREESRIRGFIKKTVARSGAKGVVLGLSGGVDSALVLALCVRALGHERVTALLMPSPHTPREDMDDAAALADSLGVRRITIPLSPIVDALISAAGNSASRIARANVQARARMTLLYYVANSQGLLVAGTGDRSEELLGFFTKYGDGGVDLLPIAHLFKTQVRRLGKHLGLPARIVGKPASPQLWPGHTAEEELPAGYEILDPLMRLIFDMGLSATEASRVLGVGRVVADRVIVMHRGSAHKRSVPPSLDSRPARAPSSRAKD